jgi:hypothetical protein
VQKANNAVISEYMNQTKYEQENYPDYNFVRPSWMQGYTQPSPYQAVPRQAEVFTQADAIINGLSQ